MLAFSNCMRSNGVSNFPDPQHFVGGNVKLTLHNYGPDNPRIQAAMNACGQLLPSGNGGGEQISVADRIDYLEAAACMRRHGLPNFPDPAFQNNSVTFNIPSSINKNSPVALRAITTCRKLIPAGLPYSGS